MHRAPKASNFFVSWDACARARVTSTVVPKRGRVAGASNQPIFSRRFTTSPTTKMAGGFNPAALTSDAALPRVVTSVSCSGFVPQRITAAGVSAARPWAMSWPVMCGRFSTPIKNTRVSTAVASLSQRTAEAAFAGSSCPVTTAKETAM